MCIWGGQLLHFLPFYIWTKTNSARPRFFLRTHICRSGHVTSPGFQTMGCFSPWLKTVALHCSCASGDKVLSWCAVFAFSLKEYVRPWLDSTLMQQSQRFLQLCYRSGHCHMSHTAASNCITLLKLYLAKQSLWRFWDIYIYIYSTHLTVSRGKL